VEASVYLFFKMQLYEEAVDRALTVHIELAKSIADKPQNDFSLSGSDQDELRKKLWLRVASHVVGKEKQIKKAMEFLQYCDLLKIEDILPFFPDFVLIDDFKEAIISALNEYNLHLVTLQNQMKDTTKSAELIREDIKLLSSNFVVVEANQRCILCKYPIFPDSFYIFPCEHAFHCNCLQSEIKKYLPQGDRALLDQNLHRLLVLETGGNYYLQTPTNHDGQSSDEETSFLQGAGNIISNIAIMRDGDGPMSSVGDIHRSVQVDKQQLKDTIDNLVAHECILCGYPSIKAIDNPFESFENENFYEN